MSKITGVKIEESWKEALKEEFQKPYFSEINLVSLFSKGSGPRPIVHANNGILLINTEINSTIEKVVEYLKITN